ncbi:MAG: bifunctional nuclease family protein [Candidatus Omnitrophica bacterium]|nr:bifunctional nuclease family protein [Candidatus Omnitrophota bacterium]
MKKADIYSLLVIPETAQYLLTLEEEAGTRLIPIWIGPSEGMAVSAALRKEYFPRPLTHDLICNTIREMNASLKKITVTDLVDGVFYASMTIGRGKKEYVVDARPSDAIAIALRAQAPIFIDDKVFEKCPVIDKPISTDEMEAFKKRLKTLKPEDFFQEKTSNGRMD